jgi:hypothetical protein
VIDITAEHLSHWNFLSSAKTKVQQGCLMFDDRPVMFEVEEGLITSTLANLFLHNVSISKVLDVGVGLGVFLRSILKCPIKEYSACEINFDSLTYAKELFTASQLPIQGNFYCCPWQSIVLELDSFDFIMYDTWPPDGYGNKDLGIFLKCCKKNLLVPNGSLGTIWIGDEPDFGRIELLNQYFFTVRKYSQLMTSAPPFWHHESLRVNFIVASELR